MLKEVTKIFEDIKFDLSGLDSTYYKSVIPIDKLKNAKASHQLDHNSTVFLLVDITFLGSATDSTLFTDTGISIFDEEAGFEEPQFIPYELIKNVDYKDGEFIFFLESGEEIPVDDRYIIYDSDAVNRYKHTFINLINLLAKLFINSQTRYWDELQKYIKEENHSKVVELSTLYLDENGDDGDYSIESYYYKAYSLYESNQIDEALEEIEYAEDLCPNEEPFLLNILSLRSDISSDLENYEDSVRCLLICKSLVNDKKQQKTFNEVYSELYTEYKNKFLGLDKEQKRIIYVADDLKFISNHYKSFKKKELPNVEFPVGHPMEDQFYIAHPYLESKYIPLHNFENILFRDKVRELSFVLQCLGANSITIESVKGSSIESIANSDINFKADAEIKIHSGGGSRNTKTESENNSKSRSQLSTKQKFTPTKKPYLPESLIWYNHEPEWQQIYQQRMNGNLDSYSINIKNQFSQFNKENEFQKIKAEYENLIVKVGAEFTKKISKQFQEEGFTEWKIEVDFVPVNELKEENIKQVSLVQSSLTKEEEDYIDMFKDAFEDDGVSSDERKLLDKKRDKLNIPPQRAEELEKIAIKSVSNFTEQEEEYIDMLKDSYEDGKISDDEKKLLNKRRDKLGISVDRANELEKIVVK